MKHLLSILIALTFVVVGCNNKQANQSQQSTTTASKVERENEDKIFRRQTFEKFINTEDSIIESGEKAYQVMLDCVEDEDGKGEKDRNKYKAWYRENVTHIDSLSRYCIELSDKGNEEGLLTILIKELGNFQSHPIATSYVCFDLNLVMTSLYFSQSDKYPDYLQKCIDLWELNRVQINAVQSGWNQSHPHYKEVLKILTHLYEKVGNTEKVAEMQALMNEVTSQSE